jgi:hypothetical protein
MAVSKPTQPIDRIVLLMVGLVTLVVSGYLIFQSFSFRSLFETRSQAKKTDIEDPGFAQIEAAREKIAQKVSWTAPEIKGKPVRLNVSVPLVQKGSELYDMYDDSKLLRPPIANTWLLNNNLEYDRDDVLELDSDNDGFTNQEEWTAKTTPSDPKSHPPYSLKIALVEVKAFPVTILFQDGSETDFQITVTDENKVKKNYFITAALGAEENKFGQFRADKAQRRFEALQYTPATAEAPGKLKVRDLEWGQEFELVRGQANESRTAFEGIFEFKMMGYGPELKQEKKEGLISYNLPNNVSLQYKIVDITSQKASILPVSAPGEPTDKPIDINLRR